MLISHHVIMPSTSYPEQWKFCLLRWLRYQADGTCSWYRIRWSDDFFGTHDHTNNIQNYDLGAREKDFSPKHFRFACFQRWGMWGVVGKDDLTIKSDISTNYKRFILDRGDTNWIIQFVSDISPTPYHLAQVFFNSGDALSVIFHKTLCNCYCCIYLRCIIRSLKAQRAGNILKLPLLMNVGS